MAEPSLLRSKLDELTSEATTGSAILRLAPATFRGFALSLNASSRLDALSIGDADAVTVAFADAALPLCAAPNASCSAGAPNVATSPVVLAPAEDAPDAPVLMVADGDKVAVGAPYLEGGKVTGEVVGNDRARKIRVIKFKRRQGYKRTQGHRQNYTELKITGIAG